MNFDGFCTQCLCAKCEKYSQCEILYPNTEDYCQYQCQGGEFSMISCNEYKERAANSSVEVNSSVEASSFD